MPAKAKTKTNLQRLQLGEAALYQKHCVYCGNSSGKTLATTTSRTVIKLTKASNRNSNNSNKQTKKIMYTKHFSQNSALFSAQRRFWCGTLRCTFACTALCWPNNGALSTKCMLVAFSCCM